MPNPDKPEKMPIYPVCSGEVKDNRMTMNNRPEGPLGRRPNDNK